MKSTAAEALKKLSKNQMLQCLSNLKLLLFHSSFSTLTKKFLLKSTQVKEQAYTKEALTFQAYTKVWTSSKHQRLSSSTLMMIITYA